MAQAQMVTGIGQSTPIPLGFCRVIADVVRRILKDQDNNTTQAAAPIKIPERVDVRE